MSEETTQTPASEGSGAASNAGGATGMSSRQAEVAAILSDKEGDLVRPRKGRRRKVSYLTINKIDKIDYKEISLLKRFINERGKILPTRQTGNTAKQQRMVTRAINRAREMALLPFVMTEVVGERSSHRRPRVESVREEGQTSGETQTQDTNEE